MKTFKVLDAMREFEYANQQNSRCDFNVWSVTFTKTVICPNSNAYVYAGNPIIITGFVVFNAIFNNISVILWGQFYLWRKPKYPEKTTDLPIRIRENNSIVFKIVVIC